MAGKSDNKAPAPIQLVSIGVVAYNEEKTLDDILNDIKAQDYPHNRIEILLVDSDSADGTRIVMEAFANASKGDFANVKLLDNPKRILPCGCNVLIDNYSGDVLIRVDAHARIPADFISKNVAVLEEGEYVCGGPRPTIASPSTPWTDTLLAAESSAFGSSIADYRGSSKKEYVSSVFHAAIRREAIEAVGHYDERLARTEDNDYFYRIQLAGYRVRFDRRIFSQQIARSSYARMMKQKYGNGFWVGRTLFVQPKCLQVYHFAPLAFVTGVAAMLLTGVFATWWPFLACTAAYLLICAALTVRTIIQSTKRCVQMLALPVVYAGIHMTYGAGTVAGIASGLWNLRKHPKGTAPFGCCSCGE